MGRQQPQVKEWEGLKVIHPNAAGLDIGSEEIWAAVAPAALPAAVRKFGTFTPDLATLADLVGGVRGRYRGDGIDGRLLDPGLRDSWRPVACGSTW